MGPRGRGAARVASVGAVVCAAVALLAPGAATQTQATGVRTLNGAGNNLLHPDWGRADTPYRRLAPPAYADGVGAPLPGPNARYISNRIFNDAGQNLFSRRGLTQWAWTWGQFMDHTFGLARGGDERRPIPTARDPLEDVRNDLGTIPFTRDAAAPGTGTSPSAPRQQVNTVSSFIDAWSVYGGSAPRLEWMRDGARLLTTPDGYLPRVGARGNARTAPEMELDGQLRAHPEEAVVAGDKRANENIALTALHTLFAREHNRIAGRLPAALPAPVRFGIARRVVAAELQYITYREFLPALGVRLPAYRGYRPDVDPSLSNEFATLGYRAHSMIHGEFELAAPRSRYGAVERAVLRRRGVELLPGEEPGELELMVPLNAAFFAPDLLHRIGLGPVLAGLGREAQYANDEQIDNALRSVLFKVPQPGARDPSACFEDPRTAGCFQGIVDLGALDIERGRDHGMPRYNDLRRALGLRPVRTFTEITGERTAAWPRDPRIDRRRPLDDPDILDVVALFDREGRRLRPGTEEADEGAVRAVRRTTLAARLRGVYGSVERIDAFVGMASEEHVPGTEMGELQLALFREQFQRLRDGDRFFYLNDPELESIRRRFGIDFRHSLSEIITMNTELERGDIAADVFRLAEEEIEEGDDEAEEDSDADPDPRGAGDDAGEGGSDEGGGSTAGGAAAAPGAGAAQAGAGANRPPRRLSPGAHRRRDDERRAGPARRR